MKFADNQVVVSLGSNHHSEQNVVIALDALYETFGKLKVASIYNVPPYGSNVNQPQENPRHYLNTVVSFCSDCSVAEVQSVLRQIEAQCGRDRSTDLVAMDIDFLFYGDQKDGASVPRIDALQCAYVLKPLAEIFPHIVPPLLEKSFSQLWECFEGQQELHAVDFVWQQQLISVAPPCVAMSFN
ncbi:hypothetical protein AB835_04330 [Candidatus Endobugula sertula]|uniref:2-amino-4-hydroxy-6-hydroxymethyldihydropteridine diphosphokinase n=1 Tax=Candidatus Endobugula sertula TaxID=62101 RepID=A0A1D2QRR3_9GAMM|nr:hypothetical protein AB835_04330 [Candidatus Endobugula sertula]